jgi:hypothetical protein
VAELVVRLERSSVWLLIDEAQLILGGVEESATVRIAPGTRRISGRFGGSVRDRAEGAADVVVAETRLEFAAGARYLLEVQAGGFVLAEAPGEGTQ